MVASAQRQSVPVLTQVRVTYSLHPLLLISLPAGSNVIVAGTAIFGASDPEQVIATLKSTVTTALAKHAN